MLLVRLGIVKRLEGVRDIAHTEGREATIDAVIRGRSVMENVNEMESGEDQCEEEDSKEESASEGLKLRDRLKGGIHSYGGVMQVARKSRRVLASAETGRGMVSTNEETIGVLEERHDEGEGHSFWTRNTEGRHSQEAP